MSNFVREQGARRRKSSHLVWIILDQESNQGVRIERDHALPLPICRFLMTSSISLYWNRPFEFPVLGYAKNVRSQPVGARNQGLSFAKR